MNDLIFLAELLETLVGFLADRGDLFEAEREYFNTQLDKIIEKGKEADDE